MVKLDQGLIDRVRQYAADLRIKKKAEDKILFGIVSRHHPTRAELAEVQYPLYPNKQQSRGAYKDYSKRVMVNNDIRLFNTENLYDQQIIGQRFTYQDIYGKKQRSYMLVLADNDNAGDSAKAHEKPRDGYNKKIKRLLFIERDKTVKARARKLLKEIER